VLVVEERVVLVAQLKDELSAPLDTATQAVDDMSKATDRARDAHGRFIKTSTDSAKAAESGAARSAKAAEGQAARTTKAMRQVTSGLTPQALGMSRLDWAISRVGGSIRTGISAPFVAAGNVVRSTGARIGGMIPDFISKPFVAAGQKVASTTSSMVSGIGSGLSKIGGMAASAGKSLASGIANGAKEAAKSVAIIGTAVVTAGTAVAISTAKAGLAFNTLGQTSRASLTTLLGSAEAANAQMGKLDAFAKKSPFSKAVFINAQRQMIGFGIETDKVLPTLDAIQNAVAAVGGTNDDIASIADTFAKIQSAGKITGEDLQSLGNYGINAADLLAKEYGTTAESMKKDISDGAVGSEKAIDGLTSAMMKKFGGAAAGVKNTWVGALDRIGSARRDIGAAMMEPFVSAMGGGAAVAWANGFADVLRNFLPLIAALSKAFAGHFVPAVDAAFSKVKKLTEAFKMDGAPQAIIALLNGQFTPALRKAFHLEEDSGIVTTITAIRSGIESIKPLLGPIIGAVVAFGGGALAGLLGPFGKFIPVLNPVLGIILGLVAASPQLRAALGDAFSTLMPVLQDVLGALQPVIMLVGAFAGQIASYLAPVIPVVVELIATLLGTVEELIPVLLPVVSAILGVAGALIQGLAPILPVVSGLIGTVVGVVAGLIPVLMPIILLVVDLAMKLIGALMPVIPPIIEIFTDLVGMLGELLMPILGALLPPIMSLITALFPLLPAVTDIILIFVQLIAAVLTPLMPLITGLANLLSAVLVGALNIVMPIVTALVGTFAGLVSYLKGPLGDAINWISGMFKALSDFMAPILDGIGKVAGMVGSGIGGALKGMFGLAGGGVIGYAGGGTVLGGYSPGVDSVPAMLSPGESVLVPELTRAIGPSNILAANHAASGGRAPGSTGGFSRANAAPAPVARTSGGGVGVMVAEGAVQITVVAQPGQSSDELAEDVWDKFEEKLEEWKRRGY
jgi:tape measure domain-containing protein